MTLSVRAPIPRGTGKRIMHSRITDYLLIPHCKSNRTPYRRPPTKKMDANAVT